MASIFSSWKIFMYLFLIPCFHALDEIVGGDYLSSAPSYMIGLRTAINDDSSKMECGGSLIAANLVLTDAHCVNSYGHPAFDIKFIAHGTIHASVSDGNLIKIIRNISHPTVNVSILVLEKSIQGTPISLAKEDQSDEAISTVATVMGWGKIQEDELVSKKLKAVNVAVVSNEECAKAFPERNINDHDICAGGVKGEDACYFDSGGPLVVNGPKLTNLKNSETRDSRKLKENAILIGVYTWGKCGLGLPSEYIRVSSIHTWINQVMKQEQINYLMPTTQTP